MNQYTLTTYKPNQEYSGYHFFILNKGLNSGKPLKEPIPNCFVCSCNSETERDFLYWFVFGLWQSKAFEPYLTGSVISFIRKKELSTVINQGMEKLKVNELKAKKNISAIQKVEIYRLNILKQIQLIGDLKKALIFEILN